MNWKVVLLAAAAATPPLAWTSDGLAAPPAPVPGLGPAQGSAGAAAPPPAPDARLSPRALLDLNGNRTVELRLPVMPPSRTWCEIESGDGQRATVEWDPVAPFGLSRTVTVNDAGPVNVSCWSEAIRPTVSPEKNFGFTFACARSAQSASSADVTPTCGPATGRKCTASFEEILAASASDMLPGLDIRLEARCGSLPPVGDVDLQAFSEGAGTPKYALRSFGASNEAAVQEIFAALAEVIVEQAAARGSAVLESRLRRLVCETELPLVHTCAAIRAVRLQDLAASGRQLQEALTADLVQLALDGQPTFGTDLRPQLELGLRAALELVGGRPSAARDMGRQLVVRLIERCKGPPGTCTPEEQIVLGVVADCQRSAACDLTAIHARLANPRNFYISAPPPEPVTWERAESFVTSALRILTPKQDTTEAEQLQGALNLVLDLAEWSCARNAINSSCASHREHILFRELVDGVLQRDVARAATAAVALGADDENREKLESFARLASALGSFMTVSTTGREPSEDERQARREARKDALRTLIDAYGSRRQRLGDWVFSLGGSLRAGVGTAWILDSPSGIAVAQVSPVSIPVGFALDGHARSRWGFHAMLSPIDLGGYLALRSGKGGDALVEPAAADAVRPSVTLAGTHLFADADLILLVGGTAGFQPKIGGDSPVPQKDRDAFFMGLVAGAYIPIIDFN